MSIITNDMSHTSICNHIKMYLTVNFSTYFVLILNLKNTITKNYM